MSVLTASYCSALLQPTIPLTSGQTTECRFLVLCLFWKFCQSFSSCTHALVPTHKSYLKLFLSVTFGSVPLNNGLPNVQQKHISKVEAPPAHLHLKDNSKYRGPTHTEPCGLKWNKAGRYCAHLFSCHSFLSLNMKQSLHIIAVGYSVLHARRHPSLLKAEGDRKVNRIFMVSVKRLTCRGNVCFPLTLSLV